MKRLLIPLMIVAASTGCTRMEPEFVSNSEVAELDEPRQAAIEATLVHYFGTPTQMKIWEVLPLRHSAAVGTVAELVKTDAAVTGLKVEWQEENWPIEAGQTLGWLSGPLEIGSGELPEVAAYDPATQVITLRQPLPTAPAVGSRFAVAPGQVLENGRLLYAEHCQHCHGVSGDGNGPTAKYLNPLPRDYRKGLFKFTSTVTTHPPARDDLARIIELGIPGTYMPSFRLLEPHELDSIVEYVRWLALRGRCETLLATDVALRETVDDKLTDQLIAFLPEEADAVVAGPWREADSPEHEYEVLPETERVPMSDESVEIGRTLFMSAKAKCADCHGQSALGDGPQTLAIETEKGYTEPGLHDEWKQIVKPRNLRSGIYRGGRRPIDIYRRIHAGIKGTPMNGFRDILYNFKDERLGLDGTEKDEALWHIVNYVLSLPYEEFEPDGGTGPVLEMTPAEQTTAAVTN